MGMDRPQEPPVGVANSSKSCCAISDAPAPEAQTWAGSFAVDALPASTSGAVVPTQPVERAWSPQIARDSSPPPLQSLLCTFLN
jgi:hypothetical protein